MTFSDTNMGAGTHLVRVDAKLIAVRLDRADRRAPRLKPLYSGTPLIERPYSFSKFQQVNDLTWRNVCGGYADRRRFDISGDP